MNTATKSIRWVELTALAFVTIVVTYLQRGACIDDAYVSFVFARNLAEGHGLVFNMGERIEGYSNFLWVILLGGLNKFFGASIPTAAQIIGILLGVVNVLLVFTISLRVLGDERRLWAFAAAGLVALDLRIAIWNVEGLENPLYVFWILAALRLFVADRNKWLWGAACLGVALTRPEGPMIFAALAGHRIYVLLREKRPPDTADIIAALLFMLPYLAYNLWRLIYFGGEIFPNTFYARGGASPINGLIYIAIELYRSWGPISALILAMAVYGAMKSKPKITHLTVWAAVGFATVAILGGDWMPNARFLVPIIPPLFIMAVAGCAGISRTKIGAAIFILLLTTQIAGVAAYELRPGFDKRWARNQDEFYMQVAKKLEALGAKEKLVAFSDIGYVTYYARIRVVDTLGLVDHHLARMPAGPQWNTDLEYVLNRRPEFVINMIRDYGKIKIGHTAFDRATQHNRNFSARYELIETIPGYEANELSWDDFKRHDYKVEFLIWNRRK